MPTSSFKLFDENKANMLTDSEYSSNAQRLNGVQSGVASSKLQNKFQYQASLVAYAIAQLMVQNGYDATDSTAVTTFVNNMSNTMLQKVVDKATDAQAKEGTNNTKWMTPALVKSAITELAPMLPAILSNETKALYGLGASAVPDDVLAELGKYKQYWWRRIPVVWHDAYVTLGDVTSVETCGYSSSSDKYTISYSASYSVDSSGNVTLVSPSKLSVSYTNYTAINALKGHYFKSNISSVPGIYFVSADAPDAVRSTIDSVRYVYIDGAELIGHAQGYTYGSAELVNSSNRNAYPDSGIQDGYEYEYLGIPFDNAVTASKIATGSYVGTGTYGINKPNSLTFDFEPKIVLIKPSTNGTLSKYWMCFTNGLGTSGGGLVWGNESYTLGYKVSYSFFGNTVQWYTTDNRSTPQANDAATTYGYIAIG